MFPDKKIKCPYTGFTKTCFEGVTEHNCPKWVHTMGNHPQTGVPMDRYDCSDAIVPLLLIENSRMQYQTAAAIESFRDNVMGKGSLAGPSMPRMIG